MGYFGLGGEKREEEGGERIYIFLKIFKGVGKSSKLYRGMYFWVMYEEQRYTKYIVILLN